MVAGATAVGPMPLAQSARGATSIALGVGGNRESMDAVDLRIASMLASGDLVRISAESEGAGARVHEYFAQAYQGVPVFGGGVSRQRADGVSVSAFGTIYEGIDLPVRPQLASVVALRGTTEAPLAALAPDTDVLLTVLPLLGDTYRLTYRATYADGRIRFVDSDSGAVVREDSAFSTQGTVGRGTGVHGDAKKVAAVQTGATFEARDLLRPGNITTRSAQGLTVTQTQLLQGAGPTASDSDNVWTNSAVVDAHVNAGWTTDYLFRRHSWNGVDGNNSLHVQVVADFATIPNNAFFAYPTSLASGTGIAAFGVSSRGVPIASLDVVGHELMHGVTFFALRRRTGGGLANVLLGELGPTTALSQGQPLSCTTSFVRFGDGSTAPFFCQNGQYVLAANHGGALNEGFSDTVGTAVEFFYEPVGTGSLRADYLIAEDTAIGGSAASPPATFRSLSDPASLLVTTGLPYPSHYDQRMRYTVAVIGGVPTAVGLSIINGSFVSVPFDEGGVHINATIIGHVYYLAIEGGTNRVSGRGVTGVGQANREQIERVFFRAMTQLSPQSTSYPLMGSVLRQSAVDLYGSGSAAFRAIDQALSASGF